jgi:hypothetical protein
VIIRILHEGQFEVPASVVHELNELDAVVEKAIAAHDEADFATALAALLDKVRAAGTELDHDSLQPSDALLPPADATLAEARDLLREDGLIPG